MLKSSISCELWDDDYDDSKMEDKDPVVFYIFDPDNWCQVFFTTLWYSAGTSCGLTQTHHLNGQVVGAGNNTNNTNNTNRWRHSVSSLANLVCSVWRGSPWALPAPLAGTGRLSAPAWLLNSSLTSTDISTPVTAGRTSVSQNTPSLLGRKIQRRKIGNFTQFFLCQESHKLFSFVTLPHFSVLWCQPVSSLYYPIHSLYRINQSEALSMFYNWISIAGGVYKAVFVSEDIGKECTCHPKPDSETPDLRHKQGISATTSKNAKLSKTVSIV